MIYRSARLFPRAASPPSSTVVLCLAYHQGKITPLNLHLPLSCLGLALHRPSHLHQHLHALQVLCQEDPACRTLRQQHWDSLERERPARETDRVRSSQQTSLQMSRPLRRRSKDFWQRFRSSWLHMTRCRFATTAGGWIRTWTCWVRFVKKERSFADQREISMCRVFCEFCCWHLSRVCRA